MKSSKEKYVTPVIVTYNSSTHILKLLKSLDNAINSELISKIIIIENNSSDKIITKKIVSNYISPHKTTIKFILSNQNNGFAKSCNKGAKLANSKYVLFINPDTELMKYSLLTMLSHADNESADLIGGTTIKQDRQVHNTVVRFPNLSIGLLEFTNLGKILGISAGHQHFYYEDIDIYKSKVDKEVEAVGGAFVLIKLKSFKQLGGFDEDFFMYLEDVDLGFRAHQEGMKVIYCPHSKIKHIGGASSQNKHHVRHQAWYDSRKIYFKKHFGLFANILIQPIFTIEECLLKVREEYL